MPKNPTKNYDLDEDQYTRSFNKADDSPTSWVCRDADCAYENAVSYTHLTLPTNDLV